MTKRVMTKRIENTDLKNELTTDLIERLIYRVREEMKSANQKTKCAGTLELRVAVPTK